MRALNGVSGKNGQNLHFHLQISATRCLNHLCYGQCRIVQWSYRIKALFVTLFFLSLFWTGVLGVTILNVGDGYAFGSIQAAIDAALVISNDDEVQICVAPGVYEVSNSILVNMFDDVHITSLTIKSKEEYGSAIITGQGNTSTTQILDIRGEISELKNVTIQGVKFNFNEQYTGCKAINAWGGLSSFTVKNCHFENTQLAVEMFFLIVF